MRALVALILLTFFMSAPASAQEYMTKERALSMAERHVPSQVKIQCYGSNTPWEVCDPSREEQVRSFAEALHKCVPEGFGGGVYYLPCSGKVAAAALAHFRVKNRTPITAVIADRHGSGLTLVTAE